MSKKAVVFHPSSELYGADRIMVEAVKAFPKGFKSIIFLPKDGPLVGYIAKMCPEAEVRIEPSMPIISRSMFTPFGIFRFVRNWYKFKSRVKGTLNSVSIEIGYVNTLASVFILPILKRHKIRRFVHVHEIIDKPRIVGWLTAKTAHLFADKIVCVSKAVQNGLIRYVNHIHSKTIVIHNGIQCIDADLKDTSKTNFYLFGRIKPEKGQWFLIQALRHIDPELLSKCNITLMGGTAPGQEHVLEELKTIIKEAGLEKCVSIKDFAARIDDAMSDADVCLVPSQMKDPFPTTVLEAMSAGRPVIATKHGGAAEALDHNYSGFLIDPNSSKDLAQAITAFINDKELARTMGLNAKEKYLRFFTREHFQNNWSGFIGSCIS